MNHQIPVLYLEVIEVIDYFEELAIMADNGVELESILDMLLRFVFQLFCDLTDN
jgi:type II secretory pathway component PulF